MRFLLFLLPVLVSAQTGGVSRRDQQVQSPAQVEATKPEDRAAVEGSVFSAASGEPVKKAALTLRRIMDTPGRGMPQNSVYMAQSDASGQYSIKGVEPGPYRLSVERAGFVTQQYGAKIPNAAGTILTLGKAQTIKDISFRLIPQGVISGRVLDEDGEPVMNVNVNCMRQAYVRGRKQWMPVNGQMTNDLGEYRIHGLSAGRYYISATFRPAMMMEAGVAGTGVDEGYAPTYYPGAASTDLASPVEVTPGAQLRSIDIQLRKTQTVRIHGRVLNGVSGKPVRNTMVRLVSRSEATFDFMPRMGRVMDQNGSFTVAGATPGSYWLMAEVMEEGGRLSGRVPLEVGTSSIDNVVLTVSPGAELAGVVKLPGGTETKGSMMRIQLEPKRMNMMMGGPPGATVNAEGAFTLKGVAPDAYTLRVMGAPEGYYVKTIRFGDADVTDSGVDFTQGVTPAEFIVTLSAGAGQIDGSVQNDKQQAASSAMVVLVPEGARREQQQYYRMANTDQNGSFSLKGIVPGEYRVYAFEQLEPGAYMDPDFMKPLESKGERVSIRENGRDSLQLKLIDTPAAQ